MNRVPPNRSRHVRDREEDEHGRYATKHRCRTHPANDRSLSRDDRPARGLIAAEVQVVKWLSEEPAGGYQTAAKFDGQSLTIALKKVG